MAPLASAVAANGRVPTHTAKVTKLFKSPDGHPNALEAAPEGLWVGEQVTDRAYLLDWNTGKVLKAVDTESSNTSGLAYGGGYLWMGANGKGLGRLPRPHDASGGAIVKVDPENGRTVGRYPVPDGGGVHGLLYVNGNLNHDKLWMTCFKWNALVQVDTADFKELNRIPLHLPRAHGLAWDPPGIWVMHSSDYVIHKLDARDGRVLEQVLLDPKSDPDPHGMDMYKGKLYYCDAGIAPPGQDSGSPHAGYIFRIDL